MKILVSKPDALGDQVMAAGFVQALRRRWPDARIVWQVRSGLEVIASLVPETAIFAPRRDADPKAEAARLWTESTAPIVLVPCAIDPFASWGPALSGDYAWWGAFVAATAWDLAVAPVVNRTALSDFTVTISAAKRRVAFTANKACQPMMEAVFSHLPAKKPEFTDEVVSSLDAGEWTQFRTILATVAADAELLPPAVQISAAAEQEAARLCPEAAVVIAPGVGANVQRAWPVQNFARLAGDLRARGHAVQWIEGPHDAAYFTALSEPEARTRLTFSADRLEVLAAVLRRARLVLCNDTAYVHLAAALDAPAVAVFGAGQKTRFIPEFGRVRVVQGDPACRGCQWQCAFERHVCVQEVAYDAVASAAGEQLDTPARGHQPRRTPLPLQPPRDAAGEVEWARDWFQQELYFLRWDGWARLQIINDVIERLKAADQRAAAAATPAPAPAPAPALPKISLIIPMGRPERADGTLRSLASQSLRFPSWEVVVVGVGASSLRGRYPELPLVPVDLEKNLLPPHTRATGVAHATGEWFLFVDDDIQLAPDFFEVLARMLAAPDTLRPPNLDPVGAIGVRLPGGRGTYFEHLTDISNFWSQQSPIRAVPHTVWYLYSAAIVVRAEAYRRSGGFNIELPNGEDVDLTQRIKAAGYILAYEPSLVAHHFHGRDSVYRMWRYFWRNGNAAQYFFAHFGGVCCYSIRTVFKRTWMDLQMNRNFQRTQGVRLGSRIPWIALNYLIVEASLEWHYQEYLWRSKKFATLPPRSASDRTAQRAFQALESGGTVRGWALYALAMLQNFADPVRR